MFSCTELQHACSAFMGALMFFCASSIGMMLGNKLAIKALPLPCSLVIIQAFGTLLLLCLVKHQLERMSLERAKQWFPAAVLFTMMLLSSIQGLHHVNVSTVIIFRNFGAIVTTAVEYCVRNEKVNAEIVLAEFAILAGAIMYGEGNSVFSWIGFSWIMANVICQVAYGVLVKHFMTTSEHFSGMSKYTLSLYNNALAFPLLLCILILQGEIWRLPQMLTAVEPMGWVWIVSTCVLGFLISTSGFGLQKFVSATVFLVINNLVKFVNIVLGVILLGDSMGLTDGTGCVIALVAGMWYSSAQARFSQRKTVPARCQI